MAAALGEADPPITPDKLIRRLMDVYEAANQEDLARELGVPYRSLQRWAAGKGINWADAIELLQRAGWLVLEGTTPDSAAQRERARRVAARLATDLEELLGVL